VPLDVYSSRIQGWLRNVKLKANPFALYEAERELGPAEGGVPILSHLFVNRPYLYRVLGDPAAPAPAFLFAGRGCGKTATRAMVAYEGQYGRLRRRVLIVHYTDFQPLFSSETRSVAQITVRDHVRAVLRAGLQAVADQLLPHAIVHLAPHDRALLRAYSRAFAAPIVEYDIASVVREEPAPIDCEAMLDRELLETFGELVAKLGREAVYVLVDRVDEFPETVGDPGAVAALLRPLVLDQGALEAPRYAFKFFLPAEVDEALHEARTDRVEWQTVLWDRTSLSELIEMRLCYYSDDLVPRMEELLAPDIRYKAMDWLIDGCRRSPRNLLRLCNLVVHHHVANTTALLIGKADVSAALLEFKRRLERAARPREVAASPNEIASPPSKGVYIDEHKRVWVDGKELPRQPSHLEFRLLEELYRRGGEPARPDELVQAVWGVSPEGQDETNLRKLLSRLRRRLEPGGRGGSRRLIDNIKGRGYYLRSQ